MGEFYHHQETRAEGCEVVIVDRLGAVERHAFATEQEAKERACAITEALSWIGTPFRDCALEKGPKGAVDCAMMLVGTYGPAGLIGDFHPGKYPPKWFQHSFEERFLDCLEKLGAVEVDRPRVGDVLVYRFGRTYAHGAVLVNAREVCHAYAAAGQVVVSALDEPLLAYIGYRGQDIPRPVRYFTMWAPLP